MNPRLFWIFALSSLVYFTQGIENLPNQGLFYYLKESLNFSPEKIMFITSFTMLAWLVKPVIGYIVDNFLNKRLWIFIALAFDAALVLFLGLARLPLVVLISFIVLNSTNTAFRDVAVDGIMCVEGKKYNTTGKIQSIQWISISIAVLITGIAGGWIAQRYDYKMAFLCLLPVYVLVGVAAFFYKGGHENDNKRASTLFKDLKRLFSDRKLLIIGLFIFLYKYSPSFGAPLLFIQRDVFGWSKIKIGALGTFGTVFGIIGAVLYYRFSQRINIKKWLFFSVFLGAVTTLSYLHYTPVSAVIYDVVYSLIGMFIFLMIMDFMARNTAKGLEATSFALLCSISNLALTASNLSGAFLLDILGLKWLIMLSSATSFLCLFLIRKI